jgi:DNA-binding NtrC family response regulator
MKQVVFASRDKDQFVDIEQMLTRKDMDIEWTGTGNGLLSLLSDTPKGQWIELVIMEEILPDMEAGPLVEAIVAQSPRTHCVVAGSMEKNEFHDKFEGYGVLMQISPHPKESDVLVLETRLDKIESLG